MAIASSTAIRVACLAAAVLSQAARADATDKIKVSVGATDDAIYLPYFIAQESGFYRKLGLDVEFVSAGGGTATPALMSGTLEFSTSGGSAVSAILKGAPL